jgi:hypothetical protein
LLCFLACSILAKKPKTQLTLFFESKSKSFLILVFGFWSAGSSFQVPGSQVPGSLVRWFSVRRFQVRRFVQGVHKRSTRVLMNHS